MNRTRHLLMTAMATVCLLAPIATHGQTQIPAAVNYQGTLTDFNGFAVPNGYYVLEFRIWKDPTSDQAGDLAWGRSIPIHVVTGGIFNVLLTDDGAPLPDGGTGSILDAFSGPDRYLGLTITQAPQGNIQTGTEIKPRQRMVSAPYTIQANTANGVAPNGVSTASLANGAVTTAKIAEGNVTSGTLAEGSVTTGKIAANAVTAEKIATNAVTTDKIADGAVRESKLNIHGDIAMNNHRLLMGVPGDLSSGVQHLSSFGGESVDGPVLFGNTSGVLGTTSGGQKAALRWQSDGGVNLFGRAQSFPWPGIGSTRQIQANTDGLIFVYSPYDRIWFQVRLGGFSGTTVFPTTTTSAPIPDAGLLFEGNHGTDITGESITFPLRKGDVVYVHKETARDFSNSSVIRFIPLGVSSSEVAATQLN